MTIPLMWVKMQTTFGKLRQAKVVLAPCMPAHARPGQVPAPRIRHVEKMSHPCTRFADEVLSKLIVPVVNQGYLVSVRVVWVVAWRLFGGIRVPRLRHALPRTKAREFRWGWTGHSTGHAEGEWVLLSHQAPNGWP